MLAPLPGGRSRKVALELPGRKRMERVCPACAGKRYSTDWWPRIRPLKLAEWLLAEKRTGTVLAGSAACAAMPAGMTSAQASRSGRNEFHMATSVSISGGSTSERDGGRPASAQAEEGEDRDDDHDKADDVDDLVHVKGSFCRPHSNARGPQKVSPGWKDQDKAEAAFLRIRCRGFDDRRPIG
ncbi:hypothetical protein [Roseococcus sp. YIM B11640]|uniref:hypothetical protein n=1 Tax=Roseococcus sp. YIM B11640 TaxID=3133973 RepID=UPI003C7C8586